MLARLSFTDFDGKNFLKETSIEKSINNSDVEKYAPNVAAGVKTLSNWAKKL